METKLKAASSPSEEQEYAAKIRGESGEWIGRFGTAVWQTVMRDAFQEGCPFRFECRTKRQDVFFRNGNQARHGINKSDWQKYRAENNTCFAIGILELWRHDWDWSGSLLLSTLDILSEPEPGFGNQRHMVYWPRKSFKKIGAFTATELFGVANGLVATDCRLAIECLTIRRKQQVSLF